VDREEIRKEWDSISETYSRKRDPTGSDSDLIDDLLERLPHEPRVLDVGCGDGARTLRKLPNGVGIDLSRRGLELAAESFDAALVQADMAQIPFVADSFDGLTAYHSVFHVPRENHGHVYEEFARVLSSGGVLLMTLPGSRFETVRKGWMGGRMVFSFPGRGKTLSLLEDAGFKEVRTVTADDPLGSSTEFVFATVGVDS